MPITRYDPFTEFAGFPASIRLFQDAVNRLLTEPDTARPWAPPVDVLETENELILKADLPGVELKDLDIQMERGTLTLRGERKFEKKDGEGVGYHRIERSYGEFVRYFSVPETVDAEKVTAEFKSGVLTVTLPKKELAKPRSIKVDFKE